jgi:GNAT superfamily N-acetyltransferase
LSTLAISPVPAVEVAFGVQYWLAPLTVVTPPVAADGALNEDRALERDGVVERQVDVAGELLLGGTRLVLQEALVAQVLGAEFDRARLVVADRHRDAQLGRIAEVGRLVEAVIRRADQRGRNPETVAAALGSFGGHESAVDGRRFGDNEGVVEAFEHVVESDLFLAGECIGHDEKSLSVAL